MFNIAEDHFVSFLEVIRTHFFLVDNYQKVRYSNNFRGELQSFSLGYIGIDLPPNIIRRPLDGYISNLVAQQIQSGVTFVHGHSGPR